MNIFEQASKHKLRFTSPSGALTVDDLWDLPLTGNPLSLNSIAKNVNRRIVISAEEDFVDELDSIDKIQILRLDILKHIIAVKKANAIKAEKTRITRQKKQRILGILDEKENDVLIGKTVEELQALLEDV